MISNLMNELENKSLGARGTSFVLAMEHDGKVGTFLRERQPCQGGETRKYFSTHGADCTQPENAKPGDLEHPFPKGRPVAIAFPKATMSSRCVDVLFKELRDYVIMSPDSPFARGFKDVHIHADGIGFTVNDTHVDPTVMIQGVQLLRKSGVLKTYTKEFLSSLATADLTLLAMNWCQIMAYSARGVSNDYYWSTTFSPKRFYLGLPNDLSGGTYYDGYDYNRSYNNSLFVPSMDDPLKPGLEATEIVFKTKDFDSRARELLDWVHAYMATEPDPIIEPYKFRTYAGKAYDSHLDYLKEKAA